MLSDPLVFTVELSTSNGKTKQYKYFGGAYVERNILLSGTVNSNKATGVVWNENKGSFDPVPTLFETKNGKTYAVLLSRTNSLYTVLQTNKSFKDITNSWAKADIELLASKMLISGKTATTYEPKSNITRAEFAALLVRALGLEEKTLTSGQYKDVPDTAWYAGYVATASAENIISGYDGKLFKPNKNISREEMAVMIIRALNVAGKSVSLPETEQAQILAKLKDNKAISTWAKNDVAKAVKLGLMSGSANAQFSPAAYADRAQSAAILKRFMVYANFMSVQ